MAIFTVHAKGDPARDAAAGLGMRLVRDGFSWPAFLFGGLWLLFRGLWLALILYVALLMGLGFAFDRLGAGDGPMVACVMAAHLWFGLEGQAMIASRLARRGMPAVAVVEAGRRDDAERRYLSAVLPRAAELTRLAGVSEGL